MHFEADSVENWSEDGLETVFFGNAEEELALVITNIPGTKDHNLEWNDQGNGCANAVKSIRLSGRSLKVQLLAKAAKLIGEASFEVDLVCEDAVLAEVRRQLPIIFGTKYAFVPTRVQPVKGPATAKKMAIDEIQYLNLEAKNIKVLPDYVAEMTALRTAKLARNPALDLRSAFEVLAKLPSLAHLTFTTDQPVPENIGDLKNLETLEMHGFKRPQVLPESFGQLKKLKELLVMGEGDVILPESFAELSELERLNMRTDSWQLPTRFDRLTKLKTLDFGNCRLRQVPEAMTGMTELTRVYFDSSSERDYAQILRVLAKVPNLRHLELTTNPIPKEIGLCRQLEELVVRIGLGSREPLRFPAEFFELPQLRRLIFTMCCFDEVPAGLGKLSGLKELVFREADFAALPESVGELENLTCLNISENPSLQSLPESLGNLSGLTALYLDENPMLTRLPASLAKLGKLEEVRLTNRENVANVPKEWETLFQ